MITDRNGDAEKAKQLMLQVGMLSSVLEHSVPEQMFVDPDSATKPEGFSAAKALGMAIAQGQKIYNINQQNRNIALANLRLDTVAMSEINSALASGREVTAHTDQLTVPGFRGSGYAITDPVTGEGVYKISGGKEWGRVVDSRNRSYSDWRAYARSDSGWKYAIHRNGGGNNYLGRYPHCCDGATV
jgi:hypothetical protein